MPVEITMPQLSDTMTEGTVVKWIKKEGDKVRESEVVAEIETDKATMESESPGNGTLAAVLAPEGAKVKVGGVIAVLATAKEDVAAVKKQYAGGSGSGGVAPAPAPPPASRPPAKPAAPPREPPRQPPPQPPRQPRDPSSAASHPDSR